MGPSRPQPHAGANRLLFATLDNENSIILLRPSHLVKDHLFACGDTAVESPCGSASAKSSPPLQSLDLLCTDQAARENWCMLTWWQVAEGVFAWRGSERQQPTLNGCAVPVHGASPVHRVLAVSTSGCECRPAGTISHVFACWVCEVAHQSLPLRYNYTVDTLCRYGSMACSFVPVPPACLPAHLHGALHADGALLCAASHLCLMNAAAPRSNANIFDLPPAVGDYGTCQGQENCRTGTVRGRAPQFVAIEHALCNMYVHHRQGTSCGQCLISVTGIVAT